MLKLKGYWYIAAPSAELARRPIRRIVEDEPLVLFRDSAGNAHALIDRCAHRGMALSHGRVAGDCIECPYHGWQYDGAGALRAVPALCASEEPPQPKTMVSFPVAERDEHLWVWLGQGTPAGEPFHFPHCGEPGWSTFFMETRFLAPVEACLENFLDVPHTLLVHPGLFRGDKQRPTKARVRRFRNSVEAEFLDEQPMQGVGPRLFFPGNTMMRHTDRFILPAVTRVDYTFEPKPGSLGAGVEQPYAFIITSQCTQREEYVVDGTTAITWRLPLPAWLIRRALRWYCRRVIQQDVDILKIQGEQIRRFGTTYLSTSADLLGSHIRGLRHQAAEGQVMQNDAAELVAETLLRI